MVESELVVPQGNAVKLNITAEDVNQAAVAWLDEHAGRVDKCIRKVVETLGPDPRPDGKVHGRALACAVKAPAMPNDAASAVILKFCEDATLEVLISGTDIGQGLRTVSAQFAAEALKAD
mgnify:CR=1 FL=1